MTRKWIFTELLLTAAIAYAVAVQVVDELSSVTLLCPLNGLYPTWTGPNGLANPLTQGQTINERGFEWANNKDLRISNAMLKHDGNYVCQDGSGNTRDVELDVQYFSSSMAQLTKIDAANTKWVFTCEVHSNPASKIEPHTFTRSGAGQAETPKTTFYPCEKDTAMQNRLKCSMTSFGYAAKEDNGRDFKCDFVYKNRTVAGIGKKLNFQFPPTSVQITGNTPITDPAQTTLKLTCSTNTSNPVSALVWRRGKEAVASENAVISSNYQSVILDSEFNGKNITQDIDIQVDKAMDNEMVFCCARHVLEEKCHSVMLEYDYTSAGCAVTNWMTLIAVCMAFVASF